MLVVTLFINVGICAHAIKLSACFECDFVLQQSLQQHCIEGVRGRPHLLGTLLSLCDGTLLDLPARAFLDLCDGALVDLRSGPLLDVCACKLLDLCDGALLDHFAQWSTYRFVRSYTFDLCSGGHVSTSAVIGYSDVFCGSVQVQW